MQKKLINTLLYVFSAIFMCAVAVLAVLYAQGYYDFSFISRQTEQPQQTEPYEDTTTPPQTTETEPQQTDAPVETLEPSDTTGNVIIPSAEDKFDYESLYASFPAYSDKFVPSSETYKPSEYTLTRLTNLPKISERFDGMMSFYTDSVTKIGNLREYSVIQSVKSRPSVCLYMDHIVVSQNGTLYFYNSRGNLLMRYVISEENPEPIFAYERDTSGNALYLIADEYFYIDGQQAAFVASDFKLHESRGAKFNYNSSYGIKSDQCYVYCSGGMYGIKKPDGSRLRSATYEQAYSFSENLGFVIYDGEMFYLKDNGKVAIEGYYPIAAQYTAPLGSIYFDSGYVAVRKINKNSKDEVIEDVDVLIDNEGNEYKLPTGYSFVSYSNQRILVKKGIRYGFYSLKGAWITDAIYRYATPYYEGFAVVGDDDGRKAVIDMDGKFVIPFSYTEISVCCGGVFVCYSDKTGYDIYVKCTTAAAE